MILISLRLVSLCLISLCLLLLLPLPVMVMSIIGMFHHHGGRRWRSLLTSHRTHQHHAARHRSS